MGYFSNGTEGGIFREEFCYRCRNWGADSRSRETDEPGCPIMDAHLLHGYGAKGEVKDILDLLIERDGITNTCTMFVEAEPA
jgi:hypothetical protein